MGTTVNKLYSIIARYWNSEDWYSWIVLDKSINPTDIERLGVYINKETAEKAFDDLIGNYIGEDLVLDAVLYESESVIDQFEQLNIDCVDINEHIEDGKLDDEILSLIDTDLCYSDLRSETVEPKEFYKEIDPHSIVIRWSWHRYIGYARTFEKIGYAYEFGVETEFDLNTGNSESTFRPNLSLLDAKTYEEVIEEIEGWKWNNVITMNQLVSLFFNKD